MFKPMSGHMKYGWMLGTLVFIFGLTHNSAKYTWWLWLALLWIWWRPTLVPTTTEDNERRPKDATKLHNFGYYPLAIVLCGSLGFFFHWFVYGKVW